MRPMFLAGVVDTGSNPQPSAWQDNPLLKERLVHSISAYVFHSVILVFAESAAHKPCPIPQYAVLLRITISFARQVTGKRHSAFKSSRTEK